MKVRRGTLILAYEVAVAAGSIPFIVLLNRLATWFGFRKKDGLFIGLVLTAEVMLLPLTLHYNLVLWWLGITALTTILPAYWFAKRIQAPGDKAVLEPSQEAISEPSEEAISEPFKDAQEAILSEGQIEIDDKADTLQVSEEKNSAKSMSVDWNEETIPNAINAIIEAAPTVDVEQITEPETIIESEPIAEPEAIAEPEQEITLEDLINCGFAAKNAGRFQSAAEWFTRALSLHPEPDLAFYLMMDACSLWLTVHKRDQAQELLRHYWPEYERLFANEQRTQLSVWLSKENLLG